MPLKSAVYPTDIVVCVALSTRMPELAERAKRGELPVLGWKGGVDKKIKKKEKFGTLFYLAQWQGLRDEDLDINLSQDVVLTCTRTGMKVTYTGDFKKYTDTDDAETQSDDAQTSS